MLKRNLTRFKNASLGIFHALRTDRSYRSQFAGGAIALAIFIYIMKPLSQVEILFLGLAWVLILITELQNSAFEAALDKLHPEIHHDIGKSKDMAAGAVLTAGFFLIFVMILVVLL